MYCGSHHKKMMQLKGIAQRNHTAERPTSPDTSVRGNKIRYPREIRAGDYASRNRRRLCSGACDCSAIFLLGKGIS